MTYRQSGRLKSFINYSLLYNFLEEWKGKEGKANTETKDRKKKLALAKQKTLLVKVIKGMMLAEQPTHSQDRADLWE